MPQTQDLLNAMFIATVAHAGTTRKGLTADPYIVHPLRVAQQAILSDLSPDATVAALLHDVVEDTSVTLADLAESFPPRVVTLVDLLTKPFPSGLPPEVKAPLNATYYARLVEDPEAVSLKLLDRADNLTDLLRVLDIPPRLDDHARLDEAKWQSWARAYLRKTHAEILPLRPHSRSSRPVRLLDHAVLALTTRLAV